MKKVLAASLLLGGLLNTAYAADNTSQQIQLLNSQIQAQLQKMQTDQQAQIKTLNTQIQTQIKQMICKHKSQKLIRKRKIKLSKFKRI